MRRKRTTLLTLTLFVGLLGAGGLWLRSEQRQYRLNRQLIAALVKGDDKQALTLVNAGADPNTRYTPTPAPSLSILVKQFLHRSPPSPNDSPTALLMACGKPWDVDLYITEAQQHRPDAPELVQAMLKHGAKVNMTDEDTKIPLTPLLWAIRRNRRNTVRVLLEQGAAVNAKDKDGMTPLLNAEQSGASPDIIRLLLEYKADVNATDKDGTTALYFAAGNIGVPNVLRLLLEHGADPNKQYDHGETVLFRVVQGGADEEPIRQLLAYGANPNIGDDDGVMPLMLAIKQHRPDLVTLLRQAGAKK